MTISMDSSHQFKVGQTASWKRGKLGKGWSDKPTSFTIVSNDRYCHVRESIPVIYLADAIVILLEPTDYSYSVIKTKSGTRTIRLWKCLVTAKKLPADEAHDLEKVIPWQERYERPFTCWIKESDLNANPTLANANERMLRELLEKHRIRQADQVRCIIA